MREGDVGNVTQPVEFLVDEDLASRSVVSALGTVSGAHLICPPPPTRNARLLHPRLRQCTPSALNTASLGSA
jgi:hypothetical protein